MTCKKHFYCSPEIKKLIDKIIIENPDLFTDADHVIRTAIITLSVDYLGYEGLSECLFSPAFTTVEEIAQKSTEPRSAGVFCNRCLLYKPCICDRVQMRGGGVE